MKKKVVFLLAIVHINFILFHSVNINSGYSVDYDYMYSHYIFFKIIFTNLTKGEIENHILPDINELQ